MSIKTTSESEEIIYLQRHDDWVGMWLFVTAVLVQCHSAELDTTAQTRHYSTAKINIFHKTVKYEEFMPTRGF